MYELTLKIRTKTDPHNLLYQIHEDIKEHVQVLGMDYHLISPRPTTDEHHGGIDSQLDPSQQEGSQANAETSATQAV